MGFELSKDALFGLVVALVTWVGVWIYLFRLDRMTKRVENLMRDNDLRRDDISGTP